MKWLKWEFLWVLNTVHKLCFLDASGLGNVD